MAQFLNCLFWSWPPSALYRAWRPKFGLRQAIECDTNFWVESNKSEHLRGLRLNDLIPPLTKVESCLSSMSTKCKAANLMTHFVLYLSSCKKKGWCCLCVENRGQIPHFSANWHCFLSVFFKGFQIEPEFTMQSYFTEQLLYCQDHVSTKKAQDLFRHTSARVPHKNSRTISLFMVSESDLSSWIWLNKPRFRFASEDHSQRGFATIADNNGITATYRESP